MWQVDLKENWGRRPIRAKFAVIQLSWWKRGFAETIATQKEVSGEILAKLKNQNYR